MNLFQIQPGTALKKNLQNYLQQATASCACVSELSGRDFMHITWTPWVIPMVKWRPPDSLHLWHVLSASCANCQLINQHHFNKIRNACFRASFLIASISPFLWLLFCIQGLEMWGEELKRNQECTNWKIRKEASHFFTVGIRDVTKLKLTKHQRTAAKSK